MQPHRKAFDSITDTDVDLDPPDETGERRKISHLAPRESRAAALRSPTDTALALLREAWHVQAFAGAIVSVVDIARDHVVVVAGHGPVGAVILARDGADEPIAFDAACLGRPMRVRFSTSDPPTLRRHRAIVAPCEMLVVPVMSWGRCLALFEVIHPSGGSFSPALVGALDTAARRYGEYLDTLGVVVGFEVEETNGGFVLRAR
jgi:hypothetical protein